MSVPLLSELREPPIVGRWYMVPVVEQYRYHDRIDDWPVIGPLHDDRRFFNFVPPHYHVDARFVTARQEWAMGVDDFETVEDVVGRYPLSTHHWPHMKGRPALARRRCRRSFYGYSFGDKTEIQAINAAYGAPAAAIVLPDGRKLCPHRKADLSQFPVDADGVVTCPLHGLRVRCPQ